YETVLRLDPEHPEAAERYGRELALGEEWERLAEFSQDVAGRGVEPAFFAAVEAMANDMRGRYSLAQSQFATAIPSLPDSIRRWYDHPPKGLDTVPDFWARSRPLWLLPYNEMRLEYWTRLTYAFLVLRDREADVIGPETPEGDALIRYGWPSRLIQVERDASKIVTGLMLDNAVALLNCDLTGSPPRCPPGAGEGMTKDFTIGRWVIWMYGADRPSLIFEKRPGMRVPRYVWDAQAEEYAKITRQRSPMTFTSKVAPAAYWFPAQIVRFKGRNRGVTDVAIYAILPARQMGLPARDSVATGLFVFRDTAGFPLVIEQRDQLRLGQALQLTYRLPLAPGRYAVALEALATAYGASANTRDALVAPAWDPATLMLSDLLIGHVLGAPGAVPPLAVRDLRIEPSRTLEVAREAVIWVVWEVYGVGVGDEGTARYEVNLALRDLHARPAPLRLLERLGVARRQGTPVVALEWTSERRLASDGRALEYVAVQLPEAQGKYELVVTVTEPGTGRSAKTSRSITIVVPN
ncbi:MAG: hypothetical protein HYS40_04140, partial [Gemmatimonadetes bacterium]|nr:hypothetical protein [Gemmatimonadota bacterium]